MLAGSTIVTVPDSERRTGVRWVILALCFLAYFVMIIDRVNISIAAKAIMPEYGLSQMEVGWIFSAFFLSYAAFNVPGGWLADRYGPRRILAIAIFLWSLFTLLTAFVETLSSTLGVVGSFILVRMLVGIGESAGPPSVMRTVANWMPPNERARGVGITLSGHALGAALTPMAIVWIMATFGWRYAFVVSGGFGLLLAIAWYWLVRDWPQEHPGVNANEAAFISGSDVAGHPSVPTRLPIPWRDMLISRDILVLMLISFVLGYAGFFFFTWFFLYLVDVRRFGMESGGFYTALPFLVAAITAPAGGWLSDRISGVFGVKFGRVGLGFICFALAALFIFAGAQAVSPQVAVLFLSLGAGLCFFSTNIVFTTAIGLVPSAASVVSGLIMLSTNIGGAISPSLMPLLAAHLGWQGALYISAGTMLFAGVGWFFVRPENVVVVNSEMIPGL